MPPIASSELWRNCLRIPAYRVSDAARYAGVSTQTVSYWQKLRRGGAPVLTKRLEGTALSYLQLIEVGVVSAMRRSGVKLRIIEATRKYLSENMGEEIAKREPAPFIYQVKGSRIWPVKI